MQVNVSAIRRQQGASVPIRFSIDKPETVVTQLKFVPNRPLRIDGSVTNTGRGYLVAGTIQAELQLSCGRCLSEYRWHLQSSLCERFCQAEERQPLQATEADAEFEDDEVDEIHFFHGDQFDIADTVREQILVSLPMKRLCREDCSGLCPTCGTDLSRGSCNCRPPSGDIRLAPLAQLLASQEGRGKGNAQS